MMNPAADSVLATARFHVQPEDVAAAQRKHARWLAARGRTWVYLIGFALLCAVVVAATTPHWTPIVVAAGAAGCLAWMIGGGLIFYAVTPILARRTIKTQPNLRHEWQIEVSERGMRAVTPNQDSFVAWGDYLAWSEDARIILLYQGERLFHFMPKRGLTPDFVDVFRRLAAPIPKR